MKIRIPNHITIYRENQPPMNFVETDCCEEEGVTVQLLQNARGIAVQVCSIADPLCYVRLRWNYTDEEMPKEAVKVLGDAWERGYGDLEWRGIVPDRFMPWYAVVSNGSDAVQDYQGRHTECFGVGVQPNAMCFWQHDTCGVTLWMDLRNGGEGVQLNGRTLEAATVIFKDYWNISAFDAVCRFCKEMSPLPLCINHPVYGANNWYYAYGNSSHEEILKDSQIIKALSKDADNCPYMVIDDGWQPNLTDAPWDVGNARFPDMKRLAQQMRDIGVRPGIWIRYLRDEKRQAKGVKSEWRMMRDEEFLDPSHPEVLRYVADTTKRLVQEWRYELIKHDFSTYDIFGKWGYQIREQITPDGWHFFDRTKTSAEIVLGFYRTILESAGNALILGCNCISHLCAGLVHLNRVGDDTSGISWSRTKKMGVNTLAFRLPQDGAFYRADADCVGIKPNAIAWEKNKIWMQLLADSGTPAFLSIEPAALNSENKGDILQAMKIASCQRNRVRPLDWMENCYPEVWLKNDTEICRFHWMDEWGEGRFAPGEEMLV